MLVVLQLADVADTSCVVPFCRPAMWDSEEGKTPLDGMATSEGVSTKVQVVVGDVNT